MKFSYTRVECFAQCPYKYKLRYLDQLKTIPDQEPSNALYLGTALHLGLETGDVEKAVEKYLENYYCVNDKNIDEVIKLEYVLQKALEILPSGECEVELSTDDFVGYIDRICPTYIDKVGIQHWDLYDYKYTTNGERYANSRQLHIYKYYYELLHLNNVIDHLYYVIIEKVGIRQKSKSKPPETLTAFRDRLRKAMEESKIYLMEVEYDNKSIQYFREACQTLESVEEFPKNPTRLCDWCEYKPYCQKGEDWMILTD